MLDHLHLIWYFTRRKPGGGPTAKEWLANSSIVDELSGSVFEHLVNRTDLPKVIKDRLHLMVESDSIIKEEFVRNPPEKSFVVLISRDLRLAADLVRLGEARGREYQVLAFPPAFYLVGRLDEVTGETDYSVIEDPGAMTYEDMAYFTEGEAPEWIFDPISVVPTRYHHVSAVKRE